MRVLLTGGLGYIGSHSCVELMSRGHDVWIVDNLSNCTLDVQDRIVRIIGRRPEVTVADIRDNAALERVFSDARPDAVIHFAALKSVAESCERPLAYFDNNVVGTLNLLACMRRHGVESLVFSSSATVYGAPEFLPLTEAAATRTTNPYGRTKLMIEQIIEDVCASDDRLRAAVLRYFNPVGAHASGLIGENPRGTPNNLLPYVAQVAAGQREHLKVFGDDYPTRDGTGVRDYIHVVDLARAHVDALEYLTTGRRFTINLGTGRGYSVLEVVRAFERASGRDVPVEIAPRRAGDVAECYADPTLAHRLLGWKAEHDLARMCEDAWRWQQSLQSAAG